MKRLALLAVVAACHRTETAAPAPSTDAAAPVLVEAAAPLAVDAGPSDPCGAERALKGGKSVGHTSLVFKIELEGGQKLAWKPNATKVRNRWRGEVAAYRLAQGLGIGANVPPACPRRFPADAALRALPAHGLDDAIAQDGAYEGAVIPWIDGLQFWALEKDPLRSEVRGWLANGPPVGRADAAELARQASDLVVFDAITGNWDRYSGDNVGMDPTGKTVLFIDNDAAFMEGPPRDRLEENRTLLAQTNHFSRSFVTAVRGLDAPRLLSLVGDHDGAPLLAPARIEEAITRTKAALKTIDAKIAAHGDTDVLSLP